jgi:hypothetical protein
MLICKAAARSPHQHPFQIGRILAVHSLVNAPKTDPGRRWQHRAMLSHRGRPVCVYKMRRTGPLQESNKKLAEGTTPKGDHDVRV